MKSWKLLFFMSLMVVAMGCGKSGGGGGGSGSSYSPYTGSNLTGTNLTYMNELQAYMSAAEPSNIRIYQKVAGAITTSSSGSSSCPGTIKKFLGIEFCVYGSTSGSTNTSNMLVTKYIAKLPANGDVNYPISCVTTDFYNCSNAGEVITYPGKGSNTALANALSGHNNSLILIGINKSGSIYQVAYGTNILSAQPTIVYTIDTSKHSMYNPQATVNYQTMTQEYLQF